MGITAGRSTRSLDINPMKRLAAIVGITAGVLAPLSDGYAVCLDDRFVSGYHIPLDKELRTAHVVAIGTVVATRDAPAPPTRLDDGTIYHLKVEETLRGKRYKRLDLFSENNSGRFPMDIGHRYLVFVSKDRGTFYVSNCGNSGELAQQSQIVEAVRKKTQKRGKA